MLAQRRRQPHRITRLNHAPHPLVLRWALRILGPLGGARALVTSRCIPESISALIGIKDSEVDLSAAAIIATVNKTCKRAKPKGHCPQRPPIYWPMSPNCSC